jgi:hypothetical protein
VGARLTPRDTGNAEAQCSDMAIGIPASAVMTKLSGVLRAGERSVRQPSKASTPSIVSRRRS